MTSAESAPKKSNVLPSGKPRPRYDLERLLGVAVVVFSDRGYDGTSVEDLSRASGLSKSSMYTAGVGSVSSPTGTRPTAS